ncbi:MAG: PQQ-binding-like beta-propeller repeat protein [Planctomycetaceae bacterium]
MTFFVERRTCFSNLSSRWCALALALTTLLCSPAPSLAEDPKPAREDDYPLSLELQVLARDLTSEEYRKVLPTMIPTDLAAEWERIGTPDNHLLFLEKHGGKEKVLADPRLKSAYEQRLKIADEFLALIREAYRKRDQKPPFDDPAKVEPILRKAGANAGGGKNATATPVRVVMPAPGAEKQWPRFRGPTGQGNAVDAVFPLHWSSTENVIWSSEIPGRGHGSPSIWDDRIFITTASKEGDERSIVCYSRTDGRRLWKYDAPKPKEQEKLYAKNSCASGTAVTDGENVVAFFGNSGLVCVDVNGKEKWAKDLGIFGTTHGPGTSPVLYQNKVILIQYQNKGETLFAAYDKSSGEELWKHARENAMCWSTPVVLRIGERDDLVYNSSHHVIGYDPETGEERWRASGSTREAIPTIVVGGGLIFSTSGRNGPTFAIRPGGTGDLTESSIAWQAVRGGPHVPSPLYLDGRLYMANDTGIVTCLDAENGKTVWQKRIGGRCSMSPVEAGGKILITNEDGKSYILQAGDRFELLAENDLGEPILATPALLDGRIYFRTASRLVCIGEKSP